jgi:hypothetical protein
MPPSAIRSNGGATVGRAVDVIHRKVYAACALRNLASKAGSEFRTHRTFLTVSARTHKCVRLCGHMFAYVHVSQHVCGLFVSICVRGSLRAGQRRPHTANCSAFGAEGPAKARIVRWSPLATRLVTLIQAVIVSAVVGKPVRDPAGGARVGGGDGVSKQGGGRTSSAVGDKDRRDVKHRWGDLANSRELKPRKH